ncbi:hypothetical protein GW17_00050872 [Ensete ventricosum]|nr:hypothetical protein GW17_00050872 [Ensete ventricosum]RZS05692.1 hypothetical protein BHM03_00036238 [Ensete ventricosum]
MCDEIESCRIVLRVLAAFSQRRQQGGGATSPHAGSATHDQAAAKAPYKGATGCSQGQLAREVGAARRGRQSLAGTPACSATPVKGAGCRAPARGYRPWPALPPTVGVAAPCEGGCRRARVTVACVGAATIAAVAQMRQEGLGHPFEKMMILPL